MSVYCLFQQSTLVPGGALATFTEWMIIAFVTHLKSYLSDNSDYNYQEMLKKCLRGNKNFISIIFIINFIKILNGLRWPNPNLKQNWGFNFIDKPQAWIFICVNYREPTWPFKFWTSFPFLPKILASWLFRWLPHSFICHCLFQLLIFVFWSASLTDNKFSQFCKPFLVSVIGFWCGPKITLFLFHDLIGDLC